MIRKLAVAVLAAVAGGMLSTAAAGAVALTSAADTQPSHFIWTSPQSGAYTLIDNGATNGNPNAILFVSNNAKPGGACGCVGNTTPVGVFYDSSAGEWAIFYEESPGITVQAGVSFNVLVVPSGNSDAFTITSSSSDIAGDTAYIDSPVTDNNPSAVLQVTPNGNPGDGAVVYNDEVTGVWYNNSRSQWGVFNESEDAMATGESFNVLVGTSSTAGGKDATLKTTKSNRNGNCVKFKNSATNGDSNAFMLDTPNYDPDGVGGQLDPDETDLIYDDIEMDVCHPDNAAMVIHDAFNLLFWNS